MLLHMLPVHSSPRRRDGSSWGEKALVEGRAEQGLSTLNLLQGWHHRSCLGVVLQRWGRGRRSRAEDMLVCPWPGRDPAAHPVCRSWHLSWTRSV